MAYQKEEPISVLMGFCETGVRLKAQCLSSEFNIDEYVAGLIFLFFNSKLLREVPNRDLLPTLEVAFRDKDRLRSKFFSGSGGEECDGQERNSDNKVQGEVMTHS